MEICGSYWGDFFIKLAWKYFKTTGKHNLTVCGSFCRKKQFLWIFVPFYWFIQKELFTTNPNFPLYFPPFLTIWEKRTFQVFLSFFLRETFFLLKREVFSKFPRKLFKTTGKHTLAVCASFCGEKLFLLIFVPFYWFDQKKLFKQIQIFLWICPFSNLLRTTNFLSISMELSERVTFWTKKRSSQ